MVIEPNLKEFEGMKTLCESGEIKLERMGDQDIIRAYYKDWGNHPELRLAPGLNVLYQEVGAGVIKPENVSPVSVIHYMGARKPWMVSMVAALGRTKRNFLGKELLKYLLCLYIQFPTCLLPKKLRKL